MKRIMMMLVAVCFCLGLCVQTNMSEAARGVHSVDYFQEDGTIEDPMWERFSEYTKIEYGIPTTYKCEIDLNSISHVNGVYSAWVFETIENEYLETISRTRREFKTGDDGNLWTRIRWETSSGNPYFGAYEPTRWKLVVVDSDNQDEYTKHETLVCLKTWMTIIIECKKQGHLKELIESEKEV